MNNRKDDGIGYIEILNIKKAFRISDSFFESKDLQESLKTKIKSELSWGNIGDAFALNDHFMKPDDKYMESEEIKDLARSVYFNANKRNMFFVCQTMEKNGHLCLLNPLNLK